MRHPGFDATTVDEVVDALLAIACRYDPNTRLIVESAQIYAN